MAHPEIVHSSSNAEVSRLVTGPLDNNVYFVQCKDSGASVMIDAPGGDPALLVKTCADKRVENVLITHGHHDHVGAVDALRAASLRTGIGSDDAGSAPATDFTISDGQRFAVGALVIEAVHTPGHTPGSMCFALTDEPILFSGDTLFPGGPGATWGSKQNFDSIIRSISGRLFDVFDDATNVLPGHGIGTTIGNERGELETWRTRGW